MLAATCAVRKCLPLRTSAIRLQRYYGRRIRLMGADAHFVTKSWKDFTIKEVLHVNRQSYYF